VNDDDELLIRKLEQAAGQPYEQLRPQIVAIAHRLWEQNQQNQLENWVQAEYILLHHLYVNQKAQEEVYTSEGPT
jgi:hypothetical protein